MQVCRHDDPEFDPTADVTSVSKHARPRSSTATNRGAPFWHPTTLKDATPATMWVMRQILLISTSNAVFFLPT